MDFFSNESKISSSVKAFKIHKGPQPACSFGRKPDSFWKCFPSAVRVPACSRSFPILRAQALPAFLVISARQFVGYAKTNFHHPVRRWHNCTDFIWGITIRLQAINPSCLDWLHKEQQMRTSISLRIHRGQDTVNAKLSADPKEIPSPQTSSRSMKTRPFLLPEANLRKKAV